MLKNPTLVLVTLMMGTSMAAIDSSIVNVSLPVIRHPQRHAVRITEKTVG